MELKDRTILHVDANNFFASVETIDKPYLKSKPVAVAGNPKKRTGIILAKNELAKKFGIKTGEVIWQAKQKCPDLVLLPPHHDIYNVYSNKLYKIYQDYTDKIERFGIDECWLDVTTSLKLFKSGEDIANTIRKRVKEELGITVSVGVSFCKIFSKLASDLKKPDAVTIILRKDFKKIVYPLPLSTLMGIGKKMQAHLNKMNVFKLGDIVLLSTKLLEDKFGKVGVDLKQKLQGFDIDPVESEERLPKSVGNGTTTAVDILSKEEIYATINFLSDKIAHRLRNKKLSACGVGVSIKTSEFKKHSKEKTISHPTNSSFIIAKTALDILKTFWKFDAPVRSVRVRTFSLLKENQLTQGYLFYDEKKEKIGHGLDFIREKYGEESLVLGSTLKNQDFLRKSFEDEEEDDIDD